MYNRYNSSPTLTNCILWGDSPDEISNAGIGQNNPTVSYSDVQGALPAGTIDGGGNVNDDPLFVRNPDDGGDGWGDDPYTPGIDEGANDDSGDLHLRPGSPCIDMGDNDAPGLDVVSTDLDGNLRMMDDPDTPDGGNPGAPGPPIVDMGPYEYWPDCNENDIPDVVDMLEGTSADCNTSTVPDECEPGGLEDCNTNGTTDWCDMQAGTSDDCNVNNLPDECEAPFPPVIHVDDDAPGASNGRNWDDAYTSLADALSLAACTPIVTEIRVAQGTYIDTYSDLSASYKWAGVGTLHSSSITAGQGGSGSSLQWNFGLDDLNGEIEVGDQVYITNRIHCESSTGTVASEYNEIASISWVGSIATIELANPIGDDYTQSWTTTIDGETWTIPTRMCVLLDLGHIQPVVSDYTATTTSGTTNEGTNPIYGDNQGSVYDVITLTFTTNVNFDIAGSNLGDLGSGAVSSETTVTNTDTSTPYFTIPTAFWGGTWASGETVEFTLTPASKPIWIQEVVPAGIDTYANNAVYFMMSGGAV